eukprot:TRINITY_DN3747_c0_g1_i2.p1 TRINITY_DN3747_c0_g1~~TRINITY_DN3747_c0_g1_i2.p1  ORF type:complete len:178 (-),score=32.38 TRINITY_DN3747_c0_g1_i2:104-637(-)
MFDINDETWSQVGLPLIGKGSWPSPREMFGSAYYGGRFIVFGGNSAHNMATNELWQFVMNKDCQWKTTCQDCSLVIGCGWCEGNDVPYKCVAGVASAPYSYSSCNLKEGPFIVEFTQCPLDHFPGWIVALVVIGCIMVLGLVMYFLLKHRKSHKYEKLPKNNSTASFQNEPAADEDT